MSKLKGMTIHQMCDFAQENPRVFELESELYQMENIREQCGDDEKCQWRMKGFLHKLNKESSQYKDKVARLNFVISRFYKFLSENY